MKIISAFVLSLLLVCPIASQVKASPAKASMEVSISIHITSDVFSISENQGIGDRKDLEIQITQGLNFLKMHSPNGVKLKLSDSDLEDPTTGNRHVFIMLTSTQGQTDVVSSNQYSFSTLNRKDSVFVNLLADKIFYKTMGGVKIKRADKEIIARLIPVLAFEIYGNATFLFQHIDKKFSDDERVNYSTEQEKKVLDFLIKDKNNSFMGPLLQQLKGALVLAQRCTDTLSKIKPQE
jgi:hypothetical protein